MAQDAGVVLQLLARPAVRSLLRRELTSKHGQARVLGETWAERICGGELRQRESWPRGERKTLTIAIGLVAQRTSDPGLAAKLAAIGDAGAAAWWAQRPARYRA